MRSPLETGAATGIGGDRTPVIVARDLRMAYGTQEAVGGIDLDVRRGEIFAFVGPSGAGKTTTAEILEGLRRRTGGEVSVLDADPQSARADWRARIGVVLQDSEPEPTLTVRECLSLCAGYYPRPRPVDETIALAGLRDGADVRCCDLSRGEKRRVDLALALVGDPELIFLDEPTSGSHPSARRVVWSAIARLRELGKTVFLTTHDMAEAEALADRIAVVAAGRIVATGTPRTLGGHDRVTSRISFTLPYAARLSDLPAPARLGAVVDDARRVSLRSAAPMAVLGSLAPWAEEHGWPLRDVEVHPPSLEDVYLRLTRDAR
jgi:ABC-2 type transport system ATP-binding protein